MTEREQAQQQLKSDVLEHLFVRVCEGGYEYAYYHGQDQCPYQSLCLYLCLPMSEQLFAITKRALGQINAVRCDWSRQLLEIEDSDSTLGQVSAELARHSA